MVTHTGEGCVSETCGLRTCLLADAEPQNFLDVWCDSRSLVDKNLQTRTDADHVRWWVYYFLV